MYHSRFKNSHYQAGYHYGELLLKHDKIIHNQHTFKITQERADFARACLPFYQQYFPAILEEIKGLAAGQKSSYEDFLTFLLSMYCFEFDNHCTCFAFRNEENIIFARNSDFLVELENLTMNCLYRLDNSYAFNGNTTAFIEMEDGINEYGLAVGLTFVYPKITKPGFNAGMLVRYLLEKCQTTKEAIACLNKLPIASQQILTIIDKHGEMAVVECNCHRVEVIRPEHDFVIATNNFQTSSMQEFQNEDIDDWNSEKRYVNGYSALKNYDFSLTLAKDILSGKYGFMCQYDRKKGADTLWSVIYDLTNKKVYRVEGNPSRKKYQEDTRLKLVY